MERDTIWRFIWSDEERFIWRFYSLLLITTIIIITIIIIVVVITPYTKTPPIQIQMLRRRVDTLTRTGTLPTVRYDWRLFQYDYTKHYTVRVPTRRDASTWYAEHKDHIRTNIDRLRYSTLTRTYQYNNRTSTSTYRRNTYIVRSDCPDTSTVLHRIRTSIPYRQDAVRVLVLQRIR